MVTANITYLARDPLYITEKPYTTDVKVEGSEDYPPSNYVLVQHPVDINPIDMQKMPDMDVTGFCILQEQTSLDVEKALADPESVEEVYMSELAHILSQRFPEYVRIEPIDFVIRKRDERFPSNEYALLSHQQPAALAHADYTLNGAMMQFNHTFPGQEAYFSARDFDVINVWRPLVGPNDDWPLAMCDHTSIDREDIVAADLLHSNRVGENQLLHYNPKHRWYYIQHQQPNDLLVFRNVDSLGKRAAAFHSAFYNPESESAPRQSCEVRFVAFRPLSNGK